MDPLPLSEQNKPLNWQVVTYIRGKISLSAEQISRKLLVGQTFQIPGVGKIIDTILIEKILNQNDFYQKQNQKQLKEAALNFVKKVVEEWSTQIAKIQRKINKQQLPKYTAKVLAFGSYVLDLKSNSSDIDLICVVPHFINRQSHFFQGLATKLQTNPEVKSVSVRKTAKVPIITFDFKEINIDLSFCKLPTEEVPRNIQRVISMDLLNSIEDQTSKISLLGRKNNLLILQLAGKAQQQNFKTTLRIIKVWAKNRGISSNAMGFLGGISWAILLAKVCQIFPYHKPIKLLFQFFNIYRLWKWKEMPVQLIQPEERDYFSDKAMMTVITPGSQVNTTERVNQITFEIIASQIERGSQILNYNNDLWTLCCKSDFIREFPMYIEIDVCGRNMTKQQEKDFKDFQGSVQSKILYLLNNFIKFNKKQFENGLKIVPHPKFYKKNDPTFELCNAFFLGIRTQTSLDLFKAVSEWCRMLSQSRQRKQKQEYLNVRIFQCKKQDFIQDVQINEVKKKQEKQDPRLALRRKVP